MARTYANLKFQDHESGFKVTKPVKRWLVHWLDLPRKWQKEFDYLEEDEKTSQRFFMYRGWYYDAFDFLKTEIRGFDGITNYTYFSGLLIKIVEDGDKVEVSSYAS